jgi:hypothetical protein
VLSIALAVFASVIELVDPACAVPVWVLSSFTRIGLLQVAPSSSENRT